MECDIIKIGVLGGIVSVDATAAFQSMLSQPLVGGTLTGLLLGDMKTGILIGILLQLIWIGVLPIGGKVPPDSYLGTIVASAIAVFFQRHVGFYGWELWLTVLWGVVISFFGMYLEIIWRRGNGILLPEAVKSAYSGKYFVISFLSLVGVFTSFVKGVIITVIGLIIGYPFLLFIHYTFFSRASLELSQTQSAIFGVSAAVVISIFLEKKLLLFIAFGMLTGVLYKLWS